MATVRHGDKVWTPARWLPGKRHYGIWDGTRRVFVHNTYPGGVQVATPDQFINGSFYIEKRAIPGFEDEVVARARAFMGQNYDLFSFNCEHLANDASEGKRESPQLQGAMLGGALVAGLWWLAHAGNGSSYDAAVDRYRDREGRFARGYG